MKDFKTCLKGLYVMFRSVRWGVLFNVLLGGMRIAFSLYFVWVCKELVDIATGLKHNNLTLYVVLMLGALLLRFLANVAYSYWEKRMVVQTQNRLRQENFAHFIRSQWTGSEAFHSGDAINRLEEDVRVVTNLLCSQISLTVVTVCQLVCASVFLLWMAPGLVWMLLALMVVAILASKMFFLTLRKLTTQIRAKESEVQGYMQENIQNRILVLTLIGTAKVLSHLGARQKEVLDYSMKRLNYSTVAHAFLNMGYLAGYVAAFLWGIYGIRNGTVTYGMMTAFLQLVGTIQGPVTTLSQQIPSFINALTSTERLMEFQELEKEEDNAPVTVQEAPGIVIQNVTFAYPGQTKPIFRNFSFTFPGGKLTAIAGLTGAGKSTLTKMILALLRPQEGSILLDGIPVSVGTRGNFMYVPQGNSLLSGTIRENLLLANSAATEAEMREVLHCAVADFVFDLPEGLDSICGEKGAGLSEGQAQRIAVARSLLHKGGVLILDEATSALDAETARQLLANLKARFANRKTILFISHREAVVDAADAVLKL